MRMLSFSVKMSIGTGIIFCTLLLGSLALTPADIGLSKFFDDVEPEPSVDGSNAQGRIVGGTVATLGTNPWMVAITTGTSTRNLHCGGSVLSGRAILTAAHCVWPVRQDIENLGNRVRAHLGTLRFDTGGQVLTIRHHVIHPAYRHVVPPRNDVALVFTINIIATSNNVRFVQLNWDYIRGGVITRVAGWGSTRQDGGGPPSSVLLQIQVRTIDMHECNIEVRNRGGSVDPRIELCTLHTSGGVCSGDSGGPLVLQERNQQVGIVAWGFPCARGAPDVYARVSAYRSWIETNMRRH